MKIAKLSLALCALCISTANHAALKALNERELKQVTGSGIGLAISDLAIESGSKGSANAFSINVRLADDALAPNDLIISGLNLHKSGTQLGGRIGSYDYPIIPGELRTMKERRISRIDPNNSGSFTNAQREHTVFYTALPGVTESQLEKSFYAYSQQPSNSLGVASAIARGANSDGFDVYSKGLPNDFFSNKPSVNIGNLHSVKNSFKSGIDAQNVRMANYSDKFDLSLRLDTKSINTTNSNIEDRFLTNLQIKGFRLYKTNALIWSHNSQNEQAISSSNYAFNGQPVTGNRGLSFAMSTGLMADALILNADPNNADASRVAFKGVDIYLPMGSLDQPLSITTVKYAQIQRGTWGDHPTRLPEKTQLRLEIAALPQSLGQAEQGHIFIQSIEFGDKNDPEVIVGQKAVHLRDANGDIVTTIPNVKHRAFVPETVIYNEQVKIYNAANPSNTIPRIPNQNVIEVRGLEIQRLVVTTQDL